MSTPRLIENEKYHGCQDRDGSRLGKRYWDRGLIESLVDLWPSDNIKNKKEINSFFLYFLMQICLLCQGNILSFWPFKRKFSLFRGKNAIFGVSPGGSAALKMFAISTVSEIQTLLGSTIIGTLSKDFSTNTKPGAHAKQTCLAVPRLQATFA